MAGTLTIGVSEDGSRLILKDESTTPPTPLSNLYYFTPQYTDPTHGGLPVGVIPFMGSKEMGSWLNPWMKNWVPLTIPNPTPIPTFDPNDAKTYFLKPSDLTVQQRQGDGQTVANMMYQVIFKGWYLYTYSGDSSANQVGGEVRGMWRTASPYLTNIKNFIQPPAEDLPVEGIHGGP